MPPLFLYRFTLSEQMIRLRNLLNSFHTSRSFHSFCQKAYLYIHDGKELIQSLKKSVLASPTQSKGCALFHKTPGVPLPAPIAFLLFPQRVNTHLTATPATLFFSYGCFTILWILGVGAHHPSSTFFRSGPNFSASRIQRDGTQLVGTD